MFARWFRRDAEAGAIASALYGAIVAQARSPALYADLGVPDTVDGRFEMVVLHTAMILDRLQREGAAVHNVGQLIFDLHCTDMDRSLREMGIGDLGVPKRMKKMASAFYGRAAAYGAAVVAGDGVALAEVLARNVWPDGDAATVHAGALADYVMASAARLNAAPALALPPAFADCSTFAPAGSAA